MKLTKSEFEKALEAILGSTLTYPVEWSDSRGSFRLHEDGRVDFAPLKTADFIEIEIKLKP